MHDEEPADGGAAGVGPDVVVGKEGALAAGFVGGFVRIGDGMGGRGGPGDGPEDHEDLADAEEGVGLGGREGAECCWGGLGC